MSKPSPRCICNKILHDRSGHTLLELLIALSIWALLLPVIAGGLLFTVQSYTRSVDRLEAREQALGVLRKVESEIRAGHGFTVQSEGVSFLDERNTLIQYRFSARTGLLQRIESGAGSSVIGAKLTDFQGRLVTLAPADGDSRPPPDVLSLHIRTQSGRAVVDLSETLTGRSPLP
ncbi:PilW family protein [Tumebacillus flagellatus]|uniref:Prepilin-type N-terminal cleavage/methylation domain-containing protein n=1 Tax=Tumebacillus flagellatus TaxID=1157490 RepID=A0A074LNK1_9BACL|nr:type II secretion system protein [Tumebacillus flagellatus]KEO82659.1 hypothetical protein EL26_13920 [Tumebacillus flagellatus]